MLKLLVLSLSGLEDSGPSSLVPVHPGLVSGNLASETIAVCFRYGSWDHLLSSDCLHATRNMPWMNGNDVFLGEMFWQSNFLVSSKGILWLNYHFAWQGAGQGQIWESSIVLGELQMSQPVPWQAHMKYFLVASFFLGKIKCWILWQGQGLVNV